MKKQVWIWVAMFTAAVLSAAPVATAQSLNSAADTTIDVVRLKQGGVLKGIITERVADERLKMLTLNGEKFSLNWGDVDSLWTERVSGNVAKRAETLRRQALNPSETSSADLNVSQSMAAETVQTGAAAVDQVDLKGVRLKIGANLAGGDDGIGFCGFFGGDFQNHAITLRLINTRQILSYTDGANEFALLYGRRAGIFVGSVGLGVATKTETEYNYGYGVGYNGSPRVGSQTGIGLALQMQVEVSAPWIGFNIGVAANLGSNSFALLMLGIQLGKLWP
ncbi:MAG: hypothetical protein IAF08_16825 [Rhizobacter sp.]|nr:hypothetical protein [Chlorobiales bacterium]